MGYGAYDPEHDDKPSFLAKLTKDRSGALIRAIAGGLYGIVGLLPYVIVSHNFLGYAGYSALNALVSFLVVKTKRNVLTTDLSIGAAVGSAVLL